MDYFKLLNLKREPFSNSPDPDFFFLSLEHRECLQKLEISLRLKRGLNVITGNVGAGKTTLCREIIRRFSHDEDVKTHLILDPGFETPGDFLKALCGFFAIDAGDLAGIPEFKEAIKKYLFASGVDQKLSSILIIDEGQKLPAFALEILRELLNYETNEHKLLQIVIFAQKEFEPVLRDHANFMDRISLFHVLGPLSPGDTRRMINYRIRQSADRGAAALPIFTRSAMWAIYRASGGYPRKIINICHQVMIALIVQNRKKAGYRLVRACIGRNPVFHKKKSPKKILAYGFFSAVVLIAVVFALNRTFYSVNLDRIANINLIGNANGQVVKKEATVVTKIKKRPDEKEENSFVVTRVTVKKNDILRELLTENYGCYNSDLVKKVMDVNPWMTDPNLITEGEVIVLPELETELQSDRVAK